MSGTIAGLPLWLRVGGAALLGGMAAAIATAIPLVDDGLKPSESLSIVLAGLVGSGLTAVPNGSQKRDSGL